MVPLLRFIVLAFYVVLNMKSESAPEVVIRKLSDFAHSERGVIVD